MCPSSVSNPSRQPSRAHSLARWFSEAGMTVLTLFAFRFGRMVRWLAGREAEGPWCGAGRGVTRGWRWFGVDLALIWRHRGDGYFLQFTWHPNRPSRALQGTFARAMISRKITENQRPATHGPQSPVSARTLAFLQFIWQGNRHFTGLQGIFARAMVPICVHRAPRTPPDSTPGHIRSRDD